MIYASPSKRSEEVLIMTSRVEVIAPEVIFTQAKAELGSAAWTSLITERLVKKLRLPSRLNYEVGGSRLR